MGTYTDLATLAEFKERVTIEGSAHDALIENLIDQVSQEIEQILGRFLGNQTHTEYYDGHGSHRLYLREGPLNAVTTLELIEYSGTTSRVETPTTIEEADYLIGGLRGEGNLGRGWIEMIAGVFLRGTRNYKIVYVAGWTTMPEDLVSYALDWAVAAYKGRETTGLQSRTIGDNSIVPFSLSSRRNQITQQLGHYMTAASIL